MAGEILDPEAFIDSYGDTAPVALGETTMTLGQALEAERLFCPADATKRQDPDRRVRYLARILASAGTLRPEDEHLLGQQE
ncbi:hypothetical protein BH09PAT4_BH09PAT4_02500 [soil metagenome]|jgi:hypothetical protein